MDRIFDNDIKFDSLTSVTLTVSDTLEVKANKVDLIVEVKVKENTYENAMKSGADKVKVIQDLVNISEDRVKVQELNVIPVYENIRHEEKSGGLFTKETVETKVVRELIGFEYNSKFIITYNVGDEELPKVYSKILLSGVAEKLNYKYYIDDIRPYEDKLLENILERAKRQVIIMANTMGYEIDSLVSIDKVINKTNVTFSNQLNTYDLEDDWDYDCDDCCFEDVVEAQTENMFNKDNVETRTISDSLNIKFKIKKIEKARV